VGWYVMTTMPEEPQEAREAFDIMERKKTAKGTTFEENLHLVYLSQGFRQERDS